MKFKNHISPNDTTTPIWKQGWLFPCPSHTEKFLLPPPSYSLFCTICTMLVSPEIRHSAQQSQKNFGMSEKSQIFFKLQRIFQVYFPHPFFHLKSFLYERFSFSTLFMNCLKCFTNLLLWQASIQLLNIILTLKNNLRKQSVVLYHVDIYQTWISLSPKPL